MCWLDLVKRDNVNIEFELIMLAGEEMLLRYFVVESMWGFRRICDSCRKVHVPRQSMCSIDVSDIIASSFVCLPAPESSGL